MGKKKKVRPEPVEELSEFFPGKFEVLVEFQTPNSKVTTPRGQMPFPEWLQLEEERINAVEGRFAAIAHDRNSNKIALFVDLQPKLTPQEYAMRGFTVSRAGME